VENLETIVEARTEVKQPTNRVGANPLLTLLPFKNMPPAKRTMADCILIVRAWAVDLVKGLGGGIGFNEQRESLAAFQLLMTVSTGLRS
jgi:hypothetical protein